MKIPNADRAIIAPEKLHDYVLNPNHRRGGSKARVLLLFGYTAATWQVLESDLRSQHLTLDVTAVNPNPWGERFEIRGPTVGPKWTHTHC